MGGLPLLFPLKSIAVCNSISPLDFPMKCGNPGSKDTFWRLSAKVRRAVSSSSSESTSSASTGVATLGSRGGVNVPVGLVLALDFASIVSGS